jgi:hypothetical protein
MELVMNKGRREAVVYFGMIGTGVALVMTGVILHASGLTGLAGVAIAGGISMVPAAVAVMVIRDIQSGFFDRDD